MKTIKTDILILGAGSGGLSVAAGAAQLGANVILLEPNDMGGDCLNTGCVPSKALLAAAHIAYTGRVAPAFGIQYAAPEIDFAAVKDHVAQVIDTIAPHDSQERFESLGVTVIRKAGRFISDTEVQAGNICIKARRIVIATGSFPVIPPISGLQDIPYLTNENIFSLKEKPEHLIIIGAGPIGMEMAQAHQRLGCQVTLIEAQTALAYDDPELTDVLKETLRDEGVTIHENCAATHILKQGTGVRVRTSGGYEIDGTHLMVVTGRKVNTDNLNLKAAGIETTNHGIRVNDRLKTTNKRVYAIGDVTGTSKFTHQAGYQAGIVVRSAVLGLPAKQRHDHIPYVIYTDPELAQVGLTESQARKKYGRKIEIVRRDYANNDRAVAQRQTVGFAKLIVYKGRPVGVSIIGAHAGELIQLWSFVIAHRMKLGKIPGMIVPYPTLGDLTKSIAGSYFSPRLFENSFIKTLVQIIQRWIP